MEPTSASSDLIATSGFVCDGKEWWRSACSGEPFYREHEGGRFCVLHFPGKDKSAEFQIALQKKVENLDFDFRGVWFPDELSFREFKFNGAANFSDAFFSAAAYFNKARFSSAADFSDAHFNAVSYFWGTAFNSVADFRGARFKSEAYFRSAIFSASAHFSDARFSANAYFRFARFIAEADFRFAHFIADANFSAAIFNRTSYFSGVHFGSASFRFAAFEDRVRFAGREQNPVFTHTSSFDLQFARIEKPDHLSFHTLTLRPHWFINIDTRKFEFINVDWDWRSVEKEIESLKRKRVSSPHRMLAIACRHLGVNAEESHRYEEASRFRYMAMNARRLEHWRGCDFRGLGWWYWLASGYGERVLRALLVLIGILIVSATLYMQVGFAQWEPRPASASDSTIAKRDEVGAPLKLTRALTYSAAVMTLQRPDPRPATAAAQTVVLVQTILGPVQAALLALAIRRKFMR